MAPQDHPPADRAFERFVRQTGKWMERHHIDPASGILLAVSGGPDSMAMWRVMSALARDRGFRLEVAHVDHNLRGTSQAEARRLRGFLAGEQTRCHVVSVRVDARRGGVEAAARKVRYQALEAIRRQRGLSLIGVGHSADDQAETVAMRVATGCGIRGLAAMRPMNGRIVRPLLWAGRDRLGALGQGIGFDPVADPSNHELRHLRARVRHLLFPLLREQFGEPVPGLCALAEEADAVERILAGMLADCAPEMVGEGRVASARTTLLRLDPFLRARWLLVALDAIGRPPRRARDTLRRFADLIPGGAPFTLVLSGARVEATALEVQVSVQGGLD